MGRFVRLLTMNIHGSLGQYENLGDHRPHCSPSTGMMLRIQGIIPKSPYFKFEKLHSTQIEVDDFFAFFLGFHQLIWDVNGCGICNQLRTEESG